MRAENGIIKQNGTRQNQELIESSFRVSATPSIAKPAVKENVNRLFLVVSKISSRLISLSYSLSVTLIFITPPYFLPSFVQLFHFFSNIVKEIFINRLKPTLIIDNFQGKESHEVMVNGPRLPDRYFPDTLTPRRRMKFLVLTIKLRSVLTEFV